MLDGIPVQEADHGGVDSVEVKAANTGGLNIGKSRLRHGRALDFEHLRHHGGGGIVEFAPPAGTKHRHVGAVRQLDGVLTLPGCLFSRIRARVLGRGRVIFLGRFLLGAVVEICHQRLGAGGHLPELLVTHHAADAVLLAEQKGGDGNLVVEFDQVLLL